MRSPFSTGYLRKGWPPNELATPYAFFRFFGVAAFRGDGAAWPDCRAVAGRPSAPGGFDADYRVPMLAAASLMMTPLRFPTTRCCSSSPSPG